MVLKEVKDFYRGIGRGFCRCFFLFIGFRVLLSVGFVGIELVCFT